VLNSIQWGNVTFDVISIETDPPFRPADFSERVTSFMKSKGYYDYAGQVGRNRCKHSRILRDILLICHLGYVRNDFKPSRRPGLKKECWNGNFKVTKKDQPDAVALCRNYNTA
jgi:hypothetical protein